MYYCDIHKWHHIEKECPRCPLNYHVTYGNSAKLGSEDAIVLGLTPNKILKLIAYYEMNTGKKAEDICGD